MNTHPLAGQVLGLAERVAATEASQATALLRQQTQRARDQGVTVVVVGEQKRGKSSLINALVGRPGLLPVDADVSTSAYLSISYGPHDRAVLIPDGLREIGPDQIAEYGSIDPVTGVERHPEIVGIEVAIPEGLLADGITLIDTPGVGGLLAGHSGITLAALDRADALLFVLNQAMELSASELDFLIRATARTGAAFFVLNAIDRNANWPRMLERNRALLEQHAPRFAPCPWFPVSSKFKTEADRRAQAGRDGADDLRTRSRIDDLAGALRNELADAVYATRLAWLLAQCLQIVQDADAEAAEQERSLLQDRQVGDDLRRQRRTLGDLLAADAPWRVMVAQRVAAMRHDQIRSADDRLVALRDVTLAMAARTGRDMPAQVERSLSDAMRGLGMDIERHLAESVAAICDDVCVSFAQAGIGVRPAELYLDADAGLSALLARPRRPPGGQEQSGGLTGLLGGSDQAAGFAAKVLVGIVVVAANAWWAVAPAAAGAFFLIRRSSGARRRSDVMARVSEVIDGQRDNFPAELRAALRQLREDLIRVATAALQARLDRADRDLAEADARLAVEQAALAPLIAAAAQHRAELAAMRATAQHLQAELAS